MARYKDEQCRICRREGCKLFLKGDRCYSDKCSVEEELTRLKSHIIQFKDLLNSNNATGKKIDFLIQEMNRETNTIGSKANNLQITNYVIEIKTELENIREQIQNVE